MVNGPMTKASNTKRTPAPLVLFVTRFSCYEELPSDMRPHVGDVLVFKTLSLNEETWTPELSSYRTAEVRPDFSAAVC